MSEGAGVRGNQPASRRQRLPATVLIAFLLALKPAHATISPPPVHPGTGRTPAVRPVVQEAPPRLIVVVVIDQFRADLLSRLRGRFGSNGFNRLLREGANFTSCFYPYALTETAPAHATLATGTTPDRHGIVSNSWYDTRRGRMIQAIEDESSPILGGASTIPGASPRALVGTTLADELSLATQGKARIFGVALKDRAAILSTGHAAAGAFWYDIQTGRFVSSKYYGETLPAWVETFNERRLADAYYGKDWVIDGRTVVSLRSRSGKADPEFYENLPYTPFVHDYLFEFTRELVVREGLGADATPDFLFIGLSGHDWLGHRDGPYSRSLEEMTVRTDLLLADLLGFLDRRMGRSGYWFALSADHGIAPTLEQAAPLRLRGLPLDLRHVRQEMEEALAARWGAGDWFLQPDRSRQLWFNRDRLSELRVSPAEAAHVTGEAALRVDGVLGYFSPAESTLGSAMTEAYRLSTFSGRSPDLILALEPFTVVAGEFAADHGTPYTYDTHVPLILLGPVFRAGAYRERVSPADLAPTLAAALGITPPALANGRVLIEALAEGPGRPSQSRGAGP